MHDAKTRRHHAKGVEGLHAPLHELVALVVALKLELHIQVHRIFLAVVVDHDGMVNDQIDRYQRFDFLRVLAEPDGRAAHGRQVCQQRNAGKVLQHHTGHHERDFLRALRVGLPVGQLGYMGSGNAFAVAMSQHRLEHDTQRNRQTRDVREFSGQRWQRIKLAGFAAGSLK